MSRPTAWQLYCNAPLFTTLLEEAGLENAHEKVTALMKIQIQLWSIDKALKEAQGSRMSLVMRLQDTHGSKNRNRENRLNIRKDLGPLNHFIIPLMSNRRRLLREVDRRIALWPEVAFDPKKLRRIPDRPYLGKLRRNMIRRGQRGLISG